MGAWGPGVFENDDAMDYAYDLAASDDWSVVGNALVLVASAPADSYIEAPEASAALAAAEVVAAALGAPGPGIPPEVVDWVADHGGDVSTAVALSALRATERVAASSELAELWAEAGPEEWRASLADLQRRLAGASPDP
jgi:Domain of unknown function (DUF4259)